MNHGDAKGEPPVRRERVSLRRVAGLAFETVRARPGLVLALALLFAVLFGGRALVMTLVWPNFDWVGVAATNDQARLIERVSRTLMNALAAACFIQLSLSAWRETEGESVPWMPALAALPAAIGVEFVRDIFSLGVSGLMMGAEPGLGSMVMGGFLFSAIYQTVLTAFFGMTVPIALERRGNLIGSVYGSLALTKGRRWRIAALTIGLSLLSALLVIPLVLVVGTRIGPVEMVVTSAFGGLLSAVTSLGLGALYRDLREIEAREALTSFD